VKAAKKLEVNDYKGFLKPISVNLLCLLAKMHRNYPSLILKLPLRGEVFDSKSEKSLRKILKEVALGINNRQKLRDLLVNDNSMLPLYSILSDEVFIDNNHEKSEYDLTSLTASASSLLKFRHIFMIINAILALLPIPLALLILFYHSLISTLLPLIVALIYVLELFANMFVMKKLSKLLV